MADEVIVGGYPMTRRYPNILKQNTATTGRVMNNDQISAIIKGELDAGYENAYKWAYLDEQRRQADLANSQAQQRTDVMKDYYEGLTPSTTGKLFEGAMNLYTPYAYQAMSKGETPWPFNTKLFGGKGGATAPTTASPESVGAVSPKPTVAGDKSFITGDNMFSENTSLSPSGQPTQAIGPGQTTGMDQSTGMLDSAKQYGTELWDEIQTTGKDVLSFFGVGETEVPALSPATQQAFDSGLGGLSSFSQTAEAALASPVGAAIPSYSSVPLETGAATLGDQAVMTAAERSISGAAGTGTQLATNASLAPAEAGIADAGGSMVGGAAGGGLSSLVGAGLGAIASMGVAWGLNELGVPSGITGLISGAVGGFIVGGPVGLFVGGMIGMLGSMIDRESWICNATAKHAGMYDSEKDAMNELKEYCKENEHAWLSWYIEHGPELISCIEEEEDDLTDFYWQIRLTMIEPVTYLISHGRMEEAFKLYKTMGLLLFYRYAPHIPVPDETMMKQGESYAEPAAI